MLNDSNEAIASIHGLDIVNVYQYTGLDEDPSTGFPKFINFCEDSVHPSTEEAHTIIANAYLNEFRRIFGEDYGTQKRLSTSYDYTWEDVELN